MHKMNILVMSWLYLQTGRLFLYGNWHFTPTCFICNIGGLSILSLTAGLFGHKLQILYSKETLLNGNAEFV